MNCLLCLAAIVVVSLAFASDGATAPGLGPNWAGPSILTTLRPGHPRLMALPGDLDRVRRLVKQHEQARACFEATVKAANDLLDKPVLEYKLIGPRLLHVSRAACERIYTLGLLYRLEGDNRYADRAVKELLAVCAFPDWHPSHFLDTAEMAHAVGIGYDWLYDRLTSEQRRAVRQAIINKALQPAAEGYRGDKVGWWVRCNHNWNQVCNGGIAIAALAIADEEPQLAGFILTSALASIPRAMNEYAPDGGWAEGPGYWSYATRYSVYLLAALDSALGTDCGLSQTPGFERAGDFRFYSLGPTNRTFNYADARDGAGAPAEMFWLARRFDKPAYAWHERQCKIGADPLNLLWFDPRGDGPRKMGLPLDRLFRGVDVAFFRSAWEDPDALFVAFKAGDNKANHSHLDLGTFVLDALGQRWALDLGPDDYNLPGYFGQQRFTYYRLRTEGHNTLTIDGRNQDEHARADILTFDSTPARACAVADLSAGYKGCADRVLRGMALIDRRYVIVQDEVESRHESQITWTMHTQAKIATKDNTANLTLSGVHLQAKIVEPRNAAFEVVSAETAPPQNENKGIRKLLIRLPKSQGPTRIVVLLAPYRNQPAEIHPTIRPLELWSKDQSQPLR